MFTNRWFIPLVTIALLSLIVIRGISLAALPNAEASGNFITTSTIVNSVTQDKFNKIFDLSSTTAYTGTLEGTSVLQGTLTVRRDGSAKFEGVETFTGLVNGVPGTLTFELVGSSDLYQEIQLNNLIINSTGELASFQGELSKTGIIKDNGPVGTYTGQINTTSNPALEKENPDEY
ncbi:MAG TPA: DUF3224 domain-containing protein [Anaerolineales bacterium]|nr:DUF3224 domain-containing protein [Anaerolineales bacterium]